MDDDAQLTRLTAELAWLRELSRALLGDADDVAHETWLVAATRPPEIDRPLRPWLHRVARNVTRMGARAATRRQARERAVAELAAPVATPEELVRRVELQRLVAGEVLALAEPYRSTVLLHYFEELSCAEIARRLEIPDGTVRRRLKVALDELRGRLAERDPKSQRGLAWLGVLAGIRGPARTTSIAAGVVVMKKVIVAIAIAILAVLVVWWARRDAAPDEAASPPRQVAAGSSLGVAGAMPGDRAPPWFSVRGAEPKRIAGRVVFEGAPVAGASVSLHHILTRAGVSPARELRSGLDGRFDFGTYPPREYELVATAPGKTAAIARIELADPLLKPPSHELELTLSACTSSITGTVFDASGGTIARAQIRREDLVGVDADAQGAYSLCLPYGGGDVTFAADGYGKLQLTIDVQGASRQDVVLVPEAVIAGQVVDEASRPVTDAHVAVFPQEWARDRAAKGTTLSGSDGRFRIAGLVPGRYRALAFADSSVSVPVEALAEVGAANTELMLRVASQGRLRGTVVSGGKPVAGAQVVAMASASSVRSATAISQADGTFVLEHVPVSDLRFTAAPYRVTAPATFALATAGERDGLVIEVEKLATIRGRVMRLGQPVAGARLCCVPTVATQDRVLLSDSGGLYEIAGVLPGTHHLGAQHDELGAFTEGTKLAIAAGEDRIVDFELDLAATVRGEVVDQEGKPVPGVFIRWTHEKTGDLGKSVTDARGQFRCASMTGGGPYRAAVYATSSEQSLFPTADGRPYPVVELANGRSTVDGVRVAIDVQRLTISGRIVDSDGAPIADAQVRALAMQPGHPPVFNSWQKLQHTFSSVGGGFTIAGLTSGMYAISARSTEGVEGVATQIAAGANNVTITIEQPGAIEGTLTGFSAPPIVYATAVDDRTNMRSGVVTGSTFRVAGLRPGRYLVTAQTTFEGDARTVEVRAGRITKLAVTARGRGTIEATVIDWRTKTPIAGAACHAVLTAEGLHGVTNWDWRVAPRSDARGRVLLDPAPAGPVGVWCVMPSNRLSIPSAEITLKPGGHAGVQLASVELTSSWPSTIGIEFDLRRITLRIVRVLPDSPALAAGLVAGDLVVSVDGASVAGLNANGVLHLIDSHDIGSSVTLGIMRGATAKTVTVTTKPRRYL